MRWRQGPGRARTRWDDGGRTDAGLTHPLREQGLLGLGGRLGAYVGERGGGDHSVLGGGAARDSQAAGVRGAEPDRRAAHLRGHLVRCA